MTVASVWLQAGNVGGPPGAEEGEMEDLCVVCWERVREVIFYQCMHMVRTSANAVAHMSAFVAYPAWYGNCLLR